MVQVHVGPPIYKGFQPIQGWNPFFVFTGILIFSVFLGKASVDFVLYLIRPNKFAIQEQ